MERSRNVGGRSFRIVLGSFCCWRVKKLLIFVLCMGGSAAAMVIWPGERMGTVYLIFGLIMYEIVVSAPGIKKTCCEADVWVSGDTITVRYLPGGFWERMLFGRKGEISLVKSRIRDIYLKEIRYGGKWLDVIGYRLIVKEDRNYVFDSVLLAEGTAAKESGVWQLQRLLIENRGKASGF